MEQNSNLSPAAQKVRGAYNKRYHETWAKRNAEQVRQYQREWRQRNPEKVKEYQRRHWERKAAEQIGLDVLDVLADMEDNLQEGENEQ